MPSPTLSKEAQNVVWRIFGSGASPLMRRSTQELIEPVISAHVPAPQRSQDIAAISGWFEENAYGYSLKPAVRDVVAGLIVDGVRGRAHGRGVWAVGALRSEWIAPVIRDRWSAAEIACFTEAAVGELEKAYKADRVLDPSRWGRVSRDEADRATVPKSAVEREGRLQTFEHLDRSVPDPVLNGVRSTVLSLLILILKLRPDYFLRLVERLDHPVLQYHLSWHWRSTGNAQRCEDLSDWISRDSGDAVIAFAIWKTLGKLREPVEGGRSGDHDTVNANQRVEQTKGHSGVDPNARVRALVDRLSFLEPKRCAGWIGELLGFGSRALGGPQGGPKPLILNALEEAGGSVVGQLLKSDCYRDLIREFEHGLRRGGARRWHRCSMALAWQSKSRFPWEAAALAGELLDEYKRNGDDSHGYLETKWHDWQDREWAERMGMAVALVNQETDVCDWVMAQCSGLPLGVWDAEGESDRFLNGERGAQQWFLIGFMAVGAMPDLKKTVAPESVRHMAHLYWEHCEFVDRYSWRDRRNGLVAEIASRYAVHFGEASDDWILGQVERAGVGARSILGLVSQREREAQEGPAVTREILPGFTEEVARIAGRRFAEEQPFILEELEQWGRVWLCLQAVDPAEETARAILRPRRERLRYSTTVLVLKLLVVVAGARKLSDDLAEKVVPLHRDVQSGYGMSLEEKPDPQEITNLLITSGLLACPDAG